MQTVNLLLNLYDGSSAPIMTGSVQVYAPAGSCPFTVTDASPAVFTWTPAETFAAAGLTMLPDGTGITLSGGSLPAPFVAGITYWIVASSGAAFQLAETPGGSPIASSAAGSGTLTVTQYSLSSLSPRTSVSLPAARPAPDGRADADQVPVANGDRAAWVRATPMAQPELMPPPSDTPTAGAVQAAVADGTAWTWGQLTPALIGSARPATVVVAASNASSTTKAAADFVCTGNSSTGGDNATIQAALQSIQSANQGRLLLSEGIFWRTSPIYLDTNNLTVEGQGDATQFTIASNGYGSAHMIIGSNGTYDGVTYTGGNTAPTSVPTEITLRNMLFQDYASNGTALPGSASGLICRGSVVLIDNISVKGVGLDGIRWEGFRRMGAVGTLGAPVPTTPAWGTAEAWAVTMASPPAVPFTCIVTPAGGGNYDPEIVNVTAVAGTSWTVQRAYMQTTAQTHASGSSIAVLNVTNTYNNVTSNAYVFQAQRAGLLTQQGLNDSEWLACIVNGGSSATQMVTQYGIWAGGSNCRWVACHPYFCATNGFYGNPQTAGQPIHAILGGEYETNGSAGIAIQQAAHCTIQGGVSLFANGAYDIALSGIPDFSIGDVWMNSAAYRHIQVTNCTQGTIHDVRMSGQNTGSMMQIVGPGLYANAEIIIHDCVFGASGGSYPTALELNNVAGVTVHHNILEQSIIESGTSDYNVITGNTLVNPVSTVNVLGPHTRSYDNTGVSDYQYSRATTITALSDRLYQLDGTNNTVALSPPGAGAGPVALAGSSVGVTLPTTSIALATGPSTWPASGTALIPVTGGYTLVNYQSRAGGNSLTGCTGGTGTTVAGTAYICPDPSLNFQAVATNTTNAVTISVPPGMTVNGNPNPLTMTSGRLYTAVLGFTPTAVNWAIY
jgi:hypothetical protein